VDTEPLFAQNDGMAYPAMAPAQNWPTATGQAESVSQTPGTVGNGGNLNSPSLSLLSNKFSADKNQQSTAPTGTTKSGKDRSNDPVQPDEEYDGAVESDSVVPERWKSYPKPSRSGMLDSSFFEIC
jgi:hypothetical protein